MFVKSKTNSSFFIQSNVINITTVWNKQLGVNLPESSKTVPQSKRVWPEGRESQEKQSVQTFA